MRDNSDMSQSPVRLTLLQAPNPEFQLQLSRSLSLPLVDAQVRYDSSTGMPSDDETIGKIIDHLVTHDNPFAGETGYILSTFQQNITQAQSLDIALARIGQPLNIALTFKPTKLSQNRENRALIRYYRTQNKLVEVDEAEEIHDICQKILLLYRKRRSHSNHDKPDLDNERVLK